MARWSKNTKRGYFRADSSCCTYEVIREPGGWRARVTERHKAGNVMSVLLTTRYEALSACEGHAHDVERGDPRPTLHLSIYWAAD